jgi:hypothetical protein
MIQFSCTIQCHSGAGYIGIIYSAPEFGAQNWCWVHRYMPTNPEKIINTKRSDPPRMSGGVDRIHPLIPRNLLRGTSPPRSQVNFFWSQPLLSDCMELRLRVLRQTPLPPGFRVSLLGIPHAPPGCIRQILKTRKGGDMKNGLDFLPKRKSRKITNPYR